MKKNIYIVPTTNVVTVNTVKMVCQSLAGIGGTAGVGKGEGDPGATLTGGADSRINLWDWDDEEEDF